MDAPADLISRLRDRPRLAALAVVALFAVLALAMFFPVITGQRWFIWDVPDQYWADLRYLCGALHDRDWPLWNPYDRAGYPFHADPQSGLYYPLNWAMCAVGGRQPSLHWAEWRVVLHFVLAGCGMTAFLRATKLTWPAAILGGVAFMTAPYQRRMWELNLTYTIAYLPVLLWATERIARQPSYRRAAVLGLLIAVATSVGSPPSLYYTALVFGTYAAVRCGPIGAARVPIIVGVLLGIAMSAVMFVPTFDMIRNSVQHGRDYASISAGGYEATELAGLVWPRNKYLYAGLPLVALAVYGALDRNSVLSRAQRICFAMLAVIAALLTLGDHTPVYRLLYHLVPGVSAFRSPVRYSAILGAALAVLGPAGAQRLPRNATASWLAIAAVLLSVWPWLPPDRDARGGPVPGDANQWASARARMGDVGSSWRMFDEFAIGLRAGTRYRARDLRGYQDPLLDARYARVIGKLHEYPRMLEQFNVRYVLRGDHYIHGSGHHFLPAGMEQSFARDLGGGVWETPGALPAVFWVPRAEVLASGDAVLERLRATAPAAVCLLEAPDAAAAAHANEPAAAGPIAAHSVRVDRDEVRAEFDAPANGWLVVNEAFDPGWTARIDGNPVAVRRANYLVRAVPVTAGRHVLRMSYGPRGYPRVAFVSMCALIAALAMTVFSRQRRSEIVAPPR